MSPKTSRAPKKPKRSLFDPAKSAKAAGSKAKSEANKARNDETKTATKKRKTEAAQDQENVASLNSEPDQSLKNKPLIIEDGSKSTKPATKKRKTEAAMDQENISLTSGVNAAKSAHQPRQSRAPGAGEKKAKGKQIKQVQGQKSIRDFFRI